MSDESTETEKPMVTIVVGVKLKDDYIIEGTLRTMSEEDAGKYVNHLEDYLVDFDSVIHFETVAIPGVYPQGEPYTVIIPIRSISHMWVKRVTQVEEKPQPAVALAEFAEWARAESNASLRNVHKSRPIDEYTMTNPPDPSVAIRK